MSSSISSSEGTERLDGVAHPAESATWRRFCGLFACTALAVLVLLYAIVLALDPYDAGRFALVTKRGVPVQGPRTANASRGRDPAFDSAIIGNSHVQLLKPERLTRATGASFVSLSVPGTGPREQMALIDYFARHRRTPNVIVLGVDGRWCTPEEAPPLAHPFPFWLYSEHDLTFLRGLLRYDTLEQVQKRVLHLFGRQKLAVADGYWDYEQGYSTLGFDKIESLRQRLEKDATTAIENHSGIFPVADQLSDQLARLPSETIVVLVRPPTFATGLPKPGTPAAAAEAACNDALARVAATRPRTALLNWRVDRPGNRLVENFFDHTHYRATLAERLAQDIVAAIRRVSAVASQ
jgi:hypothetical protein